MPREPNGHYSRKHPSGTVIAPQLAAAVKTVVKDGSITCERAHAVAQNMAMAPSAVGRAADMQNIRIIRCQLGLFTKKAAGSSSKESFLTPDHTIRQSIAAALVDDRLSCADAWNLADRFGLTRTDIGALCEHLGIRISQCQLGAF